MLKVGEDIDHDLEIQERTCISESSDCQRTINTGLYEFEIFWNHRVFESWWFWYYQEYQKNDSVFVFLQQFRRSFECANDKLSKSIRRRQRIPKLFLCEVKIQKHNHWSCILRSRHEEWWILIKNIKLCGELSIKELPRYA